MLERAVLLGAGTRIERSDLRFEAGSGEPAAFAPIAPPATDLDLTLLELERRQVEAVLQAEHGHVGRAAVRLGIPRSSLYQKVAKLGLVVPKKS